jgi:colanic acid/amylovoran biosynthesis glycosyltransferase
MKAEARPALYVVAVNPRDLELSFIRPHTQRLPADTVPVHGFVPTINGRPVLSTAVLPRLARKLTRVVLDQPWEEEITLAYERAFRQRPGAVLAEFGPTAVRLIEPCRRAGVPLIAHFHGYDISVREVLDQHRDGYRSLFAAAAAIIAVSKAMRTVLLDMGAPASRVHYCPYGVDCEVFRPGDIERSPPTFIAVGRFVDKKAPHLTILAFAQVRRQHPDARLHIIGDGSLMGSCIDLVSALGLEDAVHFMGHQPHHVVAAELMKARGFVQHSVQAWNGDCEGTPNAVLEAGASGLPVVSTRHAGIPDVVIDGRTGFLVNERDIDGTARAMAQLLRDPALAARMGAAARAHITASFNIDRRIGELWSIIERARLGSARPTALPRESARPSALDSAPH